MAVYTKIDVDTCISCDACCSEAPNIYEMRDTAFAYNDNNLGNVAVPESEEENVAVACENCPVDAVLVSEEPFE